MVKSKILFFLQDSVGGAERMTVLLGKLLPSNLYDVTFCLIEKNSKTSIRDFIPDRYPICIIPNAGPLRVMWQLFRVIYREHPHVVFSSVMYLNTKILLFRSFFQKIRFVVRCENYLYSFNKRQRLQIKYTYHRADAVIAQTDEMSEELIEQMHINKEKVYVFQNPVDKELIDRFVIEGDNPYPQNGKKHFVASGRFAYQKGFDMLMEAFIIVANKRDDVDIYILGDTEAEDGKVYKQLLSMAKKNNVDNLLYFVGYQKNPYPFIKYADCFVLSSRWEGLPNVLVEALYLGTPVAAFKCIPIIERIVSEEENGFLAEKNDILGLSEAMVNSLSLGRVKSTYNSSNVNDFIDVICGTI